MRGLAASRASVLNLLKRESFLRVLERYGIYIALGLLLLATAILSPAFYQPRNVLNVLRSAALLGIVSIGQTFVILGAGIDLSVGGLMGAAAIFVVEIFGTDPKLAVPAILFCLALGGAMGIASGLLITKRNVPPFVATLGMYIFIVGLRDALFRAVATGRPPALIRFFGLGKLLGIPAAIFVVAIIAVLAGLLLYKTAFGRQVYAVGGNRTVARLSGINVDRVTILTYVISGMLAGFAGAMLLGYIGYADPKLGRGFDLDSIAAVVVGGTSFMGGQGGLAGTMVGVLLITMLSNVVLILGLPMEMQLVAKGLVIVGAVALYSAAARS